MKMEVKPIAPEKGGWPRKGVSMGGRLVKWTYGPLYWADKHHTSRPRGEQTSSDPERACTKRLNDDNLIRRVDDVAE